MKGLATRLAKGTPSTVVQVLKQRVSRRLRGRKKPHADQLRLGLETAEDCPPRFWQPRFYDFNIWTLKKKVEKLYYLHMNRVVRRLVKHPKGWSWSSYSFYSNSKRSLIRVDPVR